MGATCFFVGFFLVEVVFFLVVLLLLEVLFFAVLGLVEEAEVSELEGAVDCPTAAGNSTPVRIRIGTQTRMRTAFITPGNLLLAG